MTLRQPARLAEFGPWEGTGRAFGGPENSLLDIELKKPIASIAGSTGNPDYIPVAFRISPTMKPSRFDPFGEQFDQRSGQDSPASKWLLWTGSAVFWSMVAFIVAARAAFFDPGVFNFGHLAALFRTVL